MNRNLRPTSSSWAVILLSMVALALAGCGRKGPLDLPPTASSPTASVAPAASDTQTEAAAKPSLFDPSYGTNAAPAAPRGRKQPFVLDPLLGN